MVLDPDARAARIHLANEAVPHNLNVSRASRVVKHKVAAPEHARQHNVQLGPREAAKPSADEYREGEWRETNLMPRHMRLPRPKGMKLRFIFSSLSLSASSQRSGLKVLGSSKTSGSLRISRSVMLTGVYPGWSATVPKTGKLHDSPQRE